MWHSSATLRHQMSDVKGCRVCGVENGLKEAGDLSVACHDCGFPVCWTCYECERTEGNRRCHSLYKERRVDGGEEEVIDDLKGGGGGDDDREMNVKESKQPLWEKIPISSSKIIPYRVVVVLRLTILAFFLRYRILTPTMDASHPWLISIICDIWLASSWILDQFPKLFPLVHVTHLDRLSLQFDRDGEPNKLAPVEIFVSSVDPIKEPPIITANTVLSILAVDYPVDKVSCYVSDDGASMLLFDTLAETSEFARKWVPFCKRHCIEPRAPEFYFFQKVDYHMDKVRPSFAKERRSMKREYEEFKVRINALVAKELDKPLMNEGWVMKDGTPWPGNMTGDHPGMIQLYLGSEGARDAEGKELPQLVYVSREKRPGYNHHKKAGAMNALVRVSALLSNAPFILNLDCDHYINNSRAVREAMCFLMDPQFGKSLCYVQFPQRFYGIDPSDRYANHNFVFFDINMKGLDGIQGPMYIGTGCVFNRKALYGYDPLINSHVNKMPKLEVAMKDAGKQGEFCSSRMKDLQKRFGQSLVFIASTLTEEGGAPPPEACTGKVELMEEAINVIRCMYEEETEWGEEISWIYGSVTEDILTGFKMHCRGWRSVYCIPDRAAFKGTAPINLSDRLHQMLRWSIGSVEILMSRHNPLWYAWGGGKIKWLERLAYINVCVYPFTSIPLITYCTFPAIYLMTGKFIFPVATDLASILAMALFLSIIATAILETRWSAVSIRGFWRVEQFWMISGLSSYPFAIFQVLLKVLAGVSTKFTVTSKPVLDEKDEFGDLYLFKWTPLMIPPTILITLNIVGVVFGVSNAINYGFGSWSVLFGKFFFPLWVLVHLQPFLKGLMGRHNATPAIVLLCVGLFFVIKMNHFYFL